MARFDEDLRLSEPKNWTGASGGPIRSQANDALGTLFKGIGNTIEAGIKMVDDENVRKIDSELYAGIDAIRDSQGVQAAVSANDSDASLFNPTRDASNTSSATLPPGIESAEAEVKRFTQARADGKISDTHYYARVESLVRQVRSRYPGYREEIDKRVSNITGTTPANALRRSLMEDITKSQTTAQKERDDWNRWVDQNAKYMSPTMRERALSGEGSPEFKAAAKKEVWDTESQAREVQSRKNELELDAAQGKFDQRKTEEYATRDVNSIVNKSFNDALDAGTRGGSLMASIQKLQTKTPTPEEITLVRQQFAAFKLRLSSEIDKTMAEPWQEGSSNSYASKMGDPSKLKAIKEQAMSRVNEMEQALINGDYGVFAANANAAKASKDASVRQLLENSGAARAIQAAREVMGPEALNLYLNNQLNDPTGTRTLSDAARAINDLAKTKAATGGSSATELIDLQRQGNVKDRGAATKELLGSTSAVLADPKTNDQTITNLAGTFYGDPKLMSKFKDAASKQEVFTRLTNPGITNNLSKNRSTDPTVWNQYRAWAGDAFFQANQGNIASISEFLKRTNKEGIEITLLPNGRLNLAQGKMPSADWRVGAGTAGGLFQGLQAQINQFNLGLNNLEAISKVEGVPLTSALAPIYSQLGLAPAGAQTEGNAPAGRAQPLMATPSSTGNEPDARDLIQLTGVEDDLIDLNAQEERRTRNTPRSGESDPNWERAGASIPNSADLKVGIRAAATELDIDPVDLATVISYETGGTFDPSIRGGAGNRHIGLIQFGPAEQRQYGASQDQTPGEQLRAVVKYLKHRGFKPGMDILDLYSTINAGRPGLYNRSDANNGGAPGTVRDKVERQMGGHRRRAARLLAD